MEQKLFTEFSYPSYWGGDIKKALYLDCDMIVLEDIAEVWNTDIGQYFIAAIIDNYSKKAGENINVPGERYFNSGFMIMNLEKWRKYNITNKVIESYKDNTHNFQFPDQDALNTVLHDKWLRLDRKWNYPAKIYNSNDKPAIIHYTTSKKPWNENPNGKDLYLKYLKKTKWE